MKEYDNIIIGFGKGGKTLAGALAQAGQTVALVEESELMFGGTCINVACIPTKALEHRARLGKNLGGDYAEKARRYQRAIQEKRALTAALREKNYQKAVLAGVEVIVGKASFVDERVIHIVDKDGQERDIRGKQIFINTGAAPFIPPIPGLKESSHAYTSETLMELETLPPRLAIIGGGYIGLEFASYFANFGSQVTIIQDSAAFLPREDQEIAAAVLKSLEQRGVQILREAQVKSITDTSEGAKLTIEDRDNSYSFTAQAILIATGRRPNMAGLHAERAGIKLTERGAIEVDEGLRTSVPHIWALGDVCGGLQFTYISLDDFRIVSSQILGDKSRTQANRGAVPYSVFLDPPFSRVGVTEDQARQAGYEISVARLPAAAIPKAQVIAEPTGLLKVIVDSQTEKILGAHLFCAESHEMINLFKLAIDAGLPYTALRDAIYTHPTMSEAINDLLATI